MILLKPTFDIHIRSLNANKASVFAASLRGKAVCKPFFKSNDFCYILNKDDIDPFIDHCEAQGVSFYIDDDVRCGDECAET